MGKILGVLGGMGPMATVELFRKIVNLLMLPMTKNIYNKSLIPDKTNYILTNKNNPINELIEWAKKFEDMGAEYLIIPCNTAHYFYKEIVKEMTPDKVIK